MNDHEASELLRASREEGFGRQMLEALELDEQEGSEEHFNALFRKTPRTGQDHIDEFELTDFATGRIEQARGEYLRRHASVCEHCENLIATEQRELAELDAYYEERAAQIKRDNAA